jgi:glyoxylase-like metal-dependent hydrolase (beta-lactamase superfamily II)
MKIQHNVVEGIHRIEHAAVNWYIVEDRNGLTIVDAGLPTSWKMLLTALLEMGKELTDIKALVLTHGHFDHIGFAERLRRETKIPVYIHDNDVPLLRHPRQYGRNRAVSWYLATQFRALPEVARLIANRAWWPEPVAEVRRIREQVLPVPGNPEVLLTPGHTHGHCSYYFPDHGALIAGDAVVTYNPYRATSYPQIVSDAATVDPERALESLAVLAATGARTVLMGHGEPWHQGVEQLVSIARSHGSS